MNHFIDTLSACLLNKEAFVNRLMGASGVGGAVLGGIGGAAASDSGSRMQGALQGAAIGGGIGLGGGGLRARRIAQQFSDDALKAGVTGINKSNASSVMGSAGSFQKATGLGKGHFRQWQDHLDDTALSGTSFVNAALTSAGALGAGVSLGGSKNPYAQFYGYYPASPYRY